jgi:hypothetical protein
MESRRFRLGGGHVLLIREAAVADARALLDYIKAISAESDFLTFGPGEFGLAEVRASNPWGMEGGQCQTQTMCRWQPSSIV